MENTGLEAGQETKTTEKGDYHLVIQIRVLNDKLYLSPIIVFAILKYNSTGIY